MRIGSIVKDGMGRYWRVFSLRYVPRFGVRAGMEGPGRHSWAPISVLLKAGCVVVRP